MRRLVIAVAACGLLVAGCGGNPEPKPLPRPSTSPSPSATATPVAQPPVMPEAAKARTKAATSLQRCYLTPNFWHSFTNLPVHTVFFGVY